MHSFTLSFFVVPVVFSFVVDGPTGEHDALLDHSRKTAGWTSRRVLIAHDSQGRVRIDECEYSEGLLAESALASACRKPVDGTKRWGETREGEEAITTNNWRTIRCAQ